MDALAKIEDYEGWNREDVVFYHVNYVRKKTAELAALRERAEKAEAERDFYRRQFPTAAKNWQKVTQAGDA